MAESGSERTSTVATPALTFSSLNNSRNLINRDDPSLRSILISRGTSQVAPTPTGSAGNGIVISPIPM